MTRHDRRHRQEPSDHAFCQITLALVKYVTSDKLHTKHSAIYRYFNICEVITSITDSNIDYHATDHDQKLVQHKISSAMLLKLEQNDF